MRLAQIDAFLIRMLYLSAAGIVVLTVLEVNAMASALFYLTFIMVVLLWLAGALRSVVWSDAVLILTIGLSLGNVITNASLEESAISFGYFKKYLMFICTLVYFQAAFKLRIDDAAARFLLRLNSLLAVFFIAVYAADLPVLYLIRGRVSGYLTFGFTNPNLVALFLVCIFTGELIQMFRNTQLPGKLLHLLLAAAMCWFVRETGSRNCLMTIMAECMLCGLLYLRRREFRLPKWFSILVAVWPILFAVAYVAFIGNTWFQEFFSFMVEEGKGLDARISVWRPALRYYAESPIVGAYSQISRGTGMSQMHNTHLDILVSYGTVVLVLVCYLLYKMISVGRGNDRKENILARICFCCTIIMGMGEAALFSGGLGIYLFAGMYLLLCNQEWKRPAEGTNL